MSIRHSVHEVELKNGAKGLFVHVPGADVFHYTISFVAGDSIVADQSKQQTAHLLEHMLCNEPRSFASRRAFSREFSRNGAYSNATTTTERTEYYGDCADMEWERIFDLQLLQLTKPNLSQTAFDTEVRTVLDELNGYLDDNSREMWFEMFKRMGSKPLGIHEEIASVDRVTLQDIREHYAHAYTTANMKFVLAGNLNEARRNKVITKLEALALPKGKAHTWQQYPLHAARGDNFGLVNRGYETNVSSIIGFVLPRALSRSEITHMRILRTLLASTDHAAIYERLREEGVSYSMSQSHNIRYDGNSLLWIESDLLPEKAMRFCKIVREELLRHAQNPFVETSLSEMQQYARASVQIGNQTVGDLCSGYASNYFYDGQIITDESVYHELDNLTEEGVRQTLLEFLKSGMWVYAEIGNTDEASLHKRYAIIESMVHEARTIS